MRDQIETADVVLHKPSGEKWLVAYCRGGYVCCCGWPQSLAPVGDCELIEKGTEQEREELIVQMASCRGGEADSRTYYARGILKDRASSMNGAGI